MPELSLTVNGKSFTGWESIRVTRSIESIAGSFELAVSDRWGDQGLPWEISEEDECGIEVDGTVILTGYVDRRSYSYAADQHSLRISGRDRTGAMVDCSALPADWEVRAPPLRTLAERLAGWFDIAVSVQKGLDLPRPPPGKFAISPGETAFTALERACRMVGVLPVSDGQGGLVLTRAGSARATSDLIEGKNILAASADYDATGRFRRYVVSAQHPGTDHWKGLPAASVHGEAQDASVRRASRVLYVLGESAMSSHQARARAEWEAKVRAARGDAVSVTVQGWTQGDGSLWPVNALVRLSSPLLGMDATLLITQVTYSLDNGSGQLTKLNLKRPDAFTPEPTVALPAKGAGEQWAGLKGGV